MKNELLKLKNQLCHPLYSASNALMRTYEPILKDLDLTYPQYLIMMSLWEEDGVQIKELSRTTLFDSGSLTPLIKKLSEKGFIVVSPSREDQRAKIISLTKKGEKLKTEALKVPELMMCQINLTASEFQSLKKLLDKLKTNLSASYINDI